MKAIVTTTINAPTEAVALFDQMPDWHLIVVGDLRTPEDYKLANGTYLSPSDQTKMDPQLSEAIGWNCIQRRNFGFLLAAKMDVEIVATVDDDNLPLPGWGQSLLINQEVNAVCYDVEEVAFDPVGATNYPHLWHRGFPLQLLARRDYSRRRNIVFRPRVQADFWNGDPDIDAICRMEHAPVCEFDHDVFPFTTSALAPFDSQNTFIDTSILGDYFLFPGIGRMDDIWAAYYVMALGTKIVFQRPSVRQQRNVHDPTEDMRQEFLGYEKNLSLTNALTKSPQAIFDFLPDRAAEAFRLYRNHF